MKKRVAIIGAGISGLTLAQQLQNHADVVIYEKARGVGGRMSTRYADPFYFDHGTQFFTARTKALRSFLRPFIENGTVAEWKGKVISLESGQKATKRLWFEPHLVAAPNMNSLCKQLSEEVDIRLMTEVAPLSQKSSDLWVIKDKEGNVLGEYDWVISTAPPAQTIALLQYAIPDDSPLHTTNMKGCYALMIGLNEPWKKEWIAAKVRRNPLQWIAINTTKPGRNKEITAIVVHSCNDWAENHMNDDMQHAQTFLLEQFEAITHISTAHAAYISTHRWKYAIVEPKKDSGFYIDPASCIAATSDWASSSRIEEAWLSSCRLALKLQAML